MSRIIGYTIIRVELVETLEYSVAEAIRNGWQPLGGVSESDSYFLQAVVRYAEKPADCKHDFFDRACVWCDYPEPPPLRNTKIFMSE